MHPAIVPDKSLLIRSFQRRYQLANREAAEICGCSLPTIQKWRSGEVAVSGAAKNLMRLLDLVADGDAKKFHSLLEQMGQKVEAGKKSGTERPAKLEEDLGAVEQVMDRLELMLENRRKVRELTEVEARYQSMVEAMEEPVCRWLPDTTLTYANPAYKRIFAKEGENLVGKKWIEFIAEPKREEIETLVWDMLRRGEGQSVMHESVGRAGQRIIQEWKDVPVLDSNRRVIEVHSFGIDRTETVELKERLQYAERMVEVLFQHSEEPMVVFNLRGEVTAQTPKVPVFLRSDDPLANLKQLSDADTLRKFFRLVRKMRGGEELIYRLRTGDNPIRMRVEMIGKVGGVFHCVGTFQEEIAIQDTEVIRARLDREGSVSRLKNVRVLKGNDHQLQSSLQWIGYALNLSRVYVFSYDSSGDFMDNLFEWCEKGVTPHIADLQHLPTEDYPWWTRRIQSGQWIRAEDIDKLPRQAANEYEILKAQNIRSILAAPVLNEANEVLGYVGFDVNDKVRHWHEQDEAALSSLVLMAKPFLVSHQSG